MTMLNDKTIELKEELKFRGLYQEFSDNELIDYERNGVSFGAILKEANHRAKWWLVESRGGGAYSLHKRNGDKLFIDGKWRTVFSGGYITHNGRQWNVEPSKNNIIDNV